MKFKTIWTIPGMSFTARLGHSRETIAQFIAKKLPLRVRYWVTVQMLDESSRKVMETLPLFQDLPVPERSMEIMSFNLLEIMDNLDKPNEVF